LAPGEGDCEGVGVTDFVHLDSFIPLNGASYGWMLADHAVMNEHLTGNYTIALTGRTSMHIAILECYGAGQNVPNHTFGMAFSSGLFSTAMAGDREGRRRAGVSWRCDGR
jgi:hypothetical protein